MRPAGVILFSPEVDLRLDEPSVTDNAESDILPWNIPTASYLHGFDASSGYVSAVDADLDGFPPAAVSWGGDEMFRDPIRRFVERLEKAGVPTHAHEVPGMFHVFQILMPWAEPSQDRLRPRRPVHPGGDGGGAAATRRRGRPAARRPAARRLTSQARDAGAGRRALGLGQPGGQELGLDGVVGERQGLPVGVGRLVVAARAGAGSPPAAEAR